MTIDVHLHMEATPVLPPFFIISSRLAVDTANIDDCYRADSDNPFVPSDIEYTLLRLASFYILQFRYA